MITPNLFILYVDNPQKSALFYSALFHQAPVENSDTFVMYVFESGWQLGLWSKHTVVPSAQVSSECTEVASRQGSKEEVDRLYQTLSTQNIPTIQAPSQLDFGYTFTALDPDGHRLRFYCMDV